MFGNRLTSSGVSSEDRYKEALEQGEAQFRKINFLIDVDVLKKCREELFKYEEKSFTRRDTERVKCFFKQSSAIIACANSLSEHFPKAKKLFSAIGNAQTAAPCLSILPEEIWNIIIQQLDFSERYVTRSVSKFFKERVDSSTALLNKNILLPYNLVFDVEGCCNIHSEPSIPSNIVIQKINGAFKPGIDIFGNNKAWFIEVFENALSRPALKQCCEYKSKNLNAVTLRSNLCQALVRDKNNPDVYCALILLGLSNSGETEADLKSYIYDLCFYNDIKDATGLEKIVKNFLNAAAYVGCIQQEKVEGLIKRIIEIALNKGIVEKNSEVAICAYQAS
jgi:hypothetical protein